MRFYLSGNSDSKGNLGVIDSEDNIEEFYPREYLESLDIEIIGINKWLVLGYKFIDDCFEYELIEKDNIIGWQLHYRNGVSKFRCKSYELGYPIISLERCFCGYGGTYIDVSGMDTSSIIDMQNMFCDCGKLTSLDVSNFNTSNVNYMTYMFCDCDNLTSLDLTNFNTSKVTDMRSMFHCCKCLTSLDLSNFDTKNVIDMRGMFFWCEKLTSLDLTNFNTSKVTDMHSMFSGCECLTSLDVSNFDTSNVIYMAYMFCGCRCLTSLDLSSFNTSVVKNMLSILSDCNNLLILSNSSRLIEQSKKDNVSSLVPSSVHDINFDKVVKLNKNFDLDFLYKKLKMLGLLGGKTIGYKFE